MDRFVFDVTEAQTSSPPRASQKSRKLRTKQPAWRLGRLQILGFAVDCRGFLRLCDNLQKGLTAVSKNDSWRGLRRLRLVLVLVTLLVGAATLADAAQADPVIAAAGDIACGTQNTVGASSCREIATSDILVGLESAGNLAAVLPLGDTQYECAELSNYNLNDSTRRGYGRSWGRVKPLTYPAIGNHEYRYTGTYSSCKAEQDKAGAPGYFGYFGYAASPLDGSPSAPCTISCKGYYSYDIGSWHLIALNSNCSAPGVSCSAGRSQETWLKNDLAQTPASKCILAYWHHPRFSSGSQSASSLQPLWQDLYDAGADVIVTGHEHFYERFARLGRSGAASDRYVPVPDPAGMRQFIVGTGGRNHHTFKTIRPGSEVRNADTYGVLKMTLHADSYEWQFIPEVGKSFSDSGSDTCHNPEAPADTTPPTAPTNLAASARSSNQVDLTWSASTDNVAVTGYDVFRDGTLLKQVGNVTSATDTTVAASTSYSYTVKARDAAENVSDDSNTATVTTPEAPPAGISFEGEGSATLNPAGTVLTVPLSSSSAGAALVASIALHTGATNSVASVTDSAGNTWTKGPIGFKSGSFTRIELWYALSTQPVTQVTVRLASNSLVGANVSEWSGVANAAALDGSASAGNASATAGSTPSLATNAGDLVLGAINTSQPVTTTLASNGFTPLRDFGEVAGENGRAAYRIVTDTGPYSVRWTFSASASSGAAILALKPAIPAILALKPG
jgi:acid phosphatase type 7